MHNVNHLDDYILRQINLQTICHRHHMKSDGGHSWKRRWLQDNSYRPSASKPICGHHFLNFAPPQQYFHSCGNYLVGWYQPYWWNHHLIKYPSRDGYEEVFNGVIIVDFPIWWGIFIIFTMVEDGIVIINGGNGIFDVKRCRGNRISVSICGICYISIRFIYGLHYMENKVIIYNSYSCTFKSSNDFITVWSGYFTGPRRAIDLLRIKRWKPLTTFFRVHFVPGPGPQI